MPTSSELKEREDRLKADEINWEAKKKQLERQIAKYNLVLDELVPKLERLNALITEKSTEYDKISSKLRAVTGDLELKQRQVTSLEGKIGTSQTILTDLEDVIARKREQLEVGLSEWQDSRRAELRSQLSADEDATGRAREALESVTAQVVAKRDELDTVRQEAAALLIEQTKQVDAHNQTMRELIASKLPLEVEVKALTDELPKLQRIKEVTIADTKKAKVQFDGFIEYERRARKVLDTKDRELQDKQQELAQEDRHLKARGSFLTGL